MLTALDYIDEVISIIRSHYTVQEGKAALMERFGLDDVQAQAIVQMPLGRLAGLEREKIQTEVDELHAKLQNTMQFWQMNRRFAQLSRKNFWRSKRNLTIQEEPNWLPLRVKWISKI